MFQNPANEIICNCLSFDNLVFKKLGLSMLNMMDLLRPNTTSEFFINNLFRQWSFPITFEAKVFFCVKNFFLPIIIYFK